MCERTDVGISVGRRLPYVRKHGFWSAVYCASARIVCEAPSTVRSRKHGLLCGAVYCAKDARMSGPSFRTYYPQWQELENLRDPAFSSNFWRRVTESPS